MAATVAAPLALLRVIGVPVAQGAARMLVRQFDDELPGTALPEAVSVSVFCK